MLLPFLSGFNRARIVYATCTKNYLILIITIVVVMCYDNDATSIEQIYIHIKRREDLVFSRYYYPACNI